MTRWRLSTNEFDYKTLLGQGDRWHRKKVCDWFPRDLPVNLESCSKEHQDYWNARPFKYYLNDWGHRCGEIDVNADNNILFLGCSLTFGIGLPKEETWPYLVSKELGMREVNLAVPGGGLDSAFRLYNAWQYEIKAPITILMIPPGKRIEFEDKDKYIRYGHWSPGIIGNKDVDDFILKYKFEDKPYNTIHDKNIAAIKWIANDTNSLLHIVDSTTAMSDFNIEVGPWIEHFPAARDGQHPGPAWNKWITKGILDEIY